MLTSEKLFKRIAAERFRERAIDGTLLKYCRTLAQVCQTMNGCLRDKELDDMNMRLEQLESRQENKHKVREYE